MSFRRGDRVSLEGVVKFATGDGMVYFDTRSGESSYAKAADLNLLSTRFENGDGVVIDGQHAIVRGVLGDWLWLEGGDGGMRSVLAEHCRRYEPVDAPPPPPPVETFVDGVRRPAYKLYGAIPPVTLGAEVSYTTADGDTLAAIAHEFGTSSDTILVQNPELELGDPLPAGLSLKIADNRIPF